MNEHVPPNGSEPKATDLRELLSAAFAEDGLESASDCPSPEWWFEWAAGNSNPTASDSTSNASPAVQSPLSAQDAVEHAATCARCSAERTLAEAFIEEQHASGTEPATSSAPLTFPKAAPPTKRPSNTMGLAGLLAAAAVLFAVIGTVSVVRTPSVRPPGSGKVVRSQTVEAIAPTGILISTPTQFEWTNVDNASTYELIIERVDGERVLARTVSTSTVNLQTTDLSLLQNFVRYRWTVVATLSNGETARSLATGFRIEPASP